MKEECMTRTLLADIGNTHFHLFDGERVSHLTYSEAIERYQDLKVNYISVKHALEARITGIANWENISSEIYLPGAYATMGIDRQALCLSHSNGLFVDAGSAITVDVVEDGTYRGGFILPGIKALQASYRSISQVLDVPLQGKLSLNTLPMTTEGGVSYGIIAPVKALVEKHRNNLPLYFTGGDGLFLSRYFEDGIYDETLVFQGMHKAIKDMDRC